MDCFDSSFTPEEHTSISSSQTDSTALELFLHALNSSCSFDDKDDGGNEKDDDETESLTSDG